MSIIIKLKNDKMNDELANRMFSGVLGVIVNGVLIVIILKIILMFFGKKGNKESNDSNDKNIK